MFESAFIFIYQESELLLLCLNADFKTARTIFTAIVDVLFVMI